MEIERIEGATREFGAPKDWDQSKGSCETLAIRDVHDGQARFMVSQWRPTAEELAALNRGESVKLWISGPFHPVVAITVGELEFV